MSQKQSSPTECEWPGCSKKPVGRAWKEPRKRWFHYCREHLEHWRNFGLPTVLISDTDIVRPGDNGW